MQTGSSFVIELYYESILDMFRLDGVPRSAFFSHETESVNEGRKSSITMPYKPGLEACNKQEKGQLPVGMFSAFFQPASLLVITSG